ncbi:MAG: HNH endonuclease [Chloroflexi bacterium]|nr:HNH endonuclease [Chloroflexota bacterium]
MTNTKEPQNNPFSNEQILTNFDYEIDMRSFPDEYRRVQFNIGWQDAIPREKAYVDSTLRKLTWRNLGYRLGLQFGQRTSAEIYEIYEHFARHFESYPSITLAEEIAPDEVLYEGGKQQITVNAYERNPKARQACIEHYGAFCQICGVNFERKYGAIGRNFIHVHHLVPLANIQETYQVNPEKDLLPVCPNCHAMLHKRNPPYGPDDIKNFLRLANKNGD